MTVRVRPCSAWPDGGGCRSWAWQRQVPQGRPLPDRPLGRPEEPEPAGHGPERRSKPVGRAVSRPVAGQLAREGIGIEAGRRRRVIGLDPVDGLVEGPALLLDLRLRQGRIEERSWEIRAVRARS
ncbi:hypothetical protein ACFQY9_05290 [Microvirga aerilata]|uniref:hypothetical protein n=1 Tax=Microvirga aerilata TaxID=670292 RepID=UPI0036334D86